jgi:hypothetical protein
MAVSHASRTLIYVIAMACGLASNLIALVMVSKVNQVVPPGGTNFVFWAEYVLSNKAWAIVPDDLLIRLHDVLLGLFFLLLFAGAWITFGLV